MNSKGLALIALLVILFNLSQAQQNHSLFLWQDVQQRNLLNPAIPISCKWYIGLPVLSSLHVNYANNAFTYNQLFTKDHAGTYQPNLDQIDKLLHRRNYIGTELHTQLFALGYKYGSYSFLFSVNEKNNIPISYPKEFLQLLLEGNATFIGDVVSTKGTGVYFSHTREWALGISQEIDHGLNVGIKAKLLFGKLNTSTRNVAIDLSTNETTFDLDFDGAFLTNSSLPIIVEVDNNQITNISLDESVGVMDLIFNSKNPGFAIDAGITYSLNDNIELSASVIDLGFISWNSNLNTFDASGQFVYQGFLNEGLNSGSYFDDLRETFLEQMNFEVLKNNYISLLPPRTIVGANYSYSNQLSGGIVVDAIFHRTKVLSAATLNLQYKPFRNLGLIGSYTAQNYSFNNLGFGFYLGQNPVQFYMVSDNALGFFKPLDARMLNLRFGININLGCKDKPSGKPQGYSGVGCFGMDSHEKSYMKKIKPWRKLK